MVQLLLGALEYNLFLFNRFYLILGMESEGIYRLSGQHSKVTQLVKLLLEGMTANKR